MQPGRLNHGSYPAAADGKKPPVFEAKLPLETEGVERRKGDVPEVVDRRRPPYISASGNVESDSRRSESRDGRDALQDQRDAAGRPQVQRIFPALDFPRDESDRRGTLGKTFNAGSGHLAGQLDGLDVLDAEPRTRPVLAYIPDTDASSGNRRDRDGRAKNLPAAFAVRAVDLDQVH